MTSLNRKIKWFDKFLNCLEMFYTTPGRMGNVYLGKFQKVKRFALKRYLLWITREVLNILSGSTLLESNSKDNFHNQFNREIMCRQLHYLLKGNKQYLYNGEISQWPCLCEICKNAVFLVTALNKKLHPECRLSLSVFELVSKFSCDDSIDKCMIRNAS